MRHVGSLSAWTTSEDRHAVQERQYVAATNRHLDQSIQMQLDERAARIKKVEASVSST
jgi:hypothetical protein